MLEYETNVLMSDRGHGVFMQREKIILGIDPGLANTGWGVIRQNGCRLDCVAYGCISSGKEQSLANRLQKVHEQMGLVIKKFEPEYAGIETVWFGDNAASAFLTGQARGAALVACAEGALDVLEFSPSEIKVSVTGTGSADKRQIQYMVAQILKLDRLPKPDHASDALAAAICCTTTNMRMK